MKDKLTLGARVVLGLIFVVFGLNGFLQFIPLPPHEGAAATYIGGLAATGYFFPVLKITEIVGGLMLLSGRFVPLALLFLAPIVVQIFLMHVFLAPDGMPMAVALVVLEGYLGFVGYRQSFTEVLRPLPSN